ncbi:MAG TPA: cell division protein FtsA [Bryobacteraceae bacterium]|nr:cell division protein FtsA [Bryobacteraceae bacterium]
MAGKPIYAAGLDVGGSRTRLVVCVLEEGRLRFLGASKVESRGWLKGRIADQRAVTETILQALAEAEAASGTSVESAVVGLGGPTIRGANSRGVLELGYVREIEQRDISRVVGRASRVQLQEDRMLLQLFPQDFVVDEHPGHRDPRKMLAARLEINVHIVTASVQEHNALVGAVNQAHLAVEETVFEALAACYAAVLPDERREGIAVVDIGSQSTEVVVYYGDAMHLAATVRICGDHFTRDLAQGLCLSFEDAELVKLEYGGALADSSPDNVLVDLPMPEAREHRHAPRRFVNQILQARAEELFRFVQAELSRVGMDRALIGGVFLTGRAARLPDLCDVAERVLQCQARFGLPFGIQDWPESMNDPEWSVAAGLAMYSAKLKAQESRATAGWLGKLLK